MNEQVSRFVSFVSKCDHLLDPKILNKIIPTSLLGYFVKELYDYMKRLIKVDMKCLHEFRNLSEELKHYQKTK